MPETMDVVEEAIRCAREAGVEVEKYPATVITVKVELLDPAKMPGNLRAAIVLEEALGANGFVAAETTHLDHAGTYAVRSWTRRGLLPYSRLPIP